MRRSLVKTIIVGVIAGISCLIVPTGSYNNTPVAIYQQPFNIAVFYLMYFEIQTDFFYEHSMFDIRCKTIFRAKLLCISRTELFSLLYILVYFLVSCAVSLLISPDNSALCFSPFSLAIWLTSSVINLSILNILYKNYSLGMKQRLRLAQAIMENPDYLILDEPINALDTEGIEIADSIIDEYHSLGRTILMTSHNANDIERHCDYVLKVDKLSVHCV